MNRKSKVNSRMTDALLENIAGLRCYLMGFFSSNQDVEDVLQETCIRAVESEKL